MNDFPEEQPPLGLRRRRRTIPDDWNDEPEPAAEDPAEAPPPQPFRQLVPTPPAAAAPQPIRSPPSDATIVAASLSSWRISQGYCFLSTILAVLAILVAPPASSMGDMKSPIMSMGIKLSPLSGAGGSSSSLPSSKTWSSSVEQVAKAAAVGIASKRYVAVGEPDTDTRDLLQSIQQWWNAQLERNEEPAFSDTSASASSTSDAFQQQQHHQTYQQNSHSPPWFWRYNKKQAAAANSQGSAESTIFASRIPRILWSWIDPVIWQHSTNPSAAAQEIIDKVLTSTPRLLTIANFLLAMTYLVHSAVAAWFLGDSSTANAPFAAMGVGDATGARPSANDAGGTIQTPDPHMADWSGPARERMGGFLVFKLLLISAVVAPDTLDLLILLTWYTLLSCLRSLDHLAHTTTTHLSALGQSPTSGVVQLLLLVLVCDILAAASCVALFHAAGLGMVLLLTCDCALLAADVLSHILKHFTCVVEDLHSQMIQSLEARQLELHNYNHQHHQGASPRSLSTEDEEQEIDSPHDEFGMMEDYEHGASTFDRLQAGMHEQEEESQIQLLASPERILRESRRLDRRMEVLDLAHARRLGIMENVMLGLELLCHILTVAHLCHIWSLHGVQFTLIDGILALHLHAAISNACKKILQRRNIHSIARDLHNLFSNASDQELRKASLAGDVCCICLGTMSTGGHVKKIPCGHLYHTHCLREVVERAQSVQAAKCPLCRASLLDGRRPGERDSSRNAPAPNQPPVAAAALAVAAVAGDQLQAPPGAGGERALFRFSTEGIIPTWIPIPAFSFEVVRRPQLQGPVLPPRFARPAVQPMAPTVVSEGEEVHEAVLDPPLEPHPNLVNTGADDPAPMVQQAQAPPEQQQQPPQHHPSLFRRLLLYSGAIPMSPEEETRSLSQLVDMFPQYERSHLLRELRLRGSAESVAEAILMGVFTSGVPRGE